MLGLTLKQLLMGINMYETVDILDEFAEDYIEINVREALKTLDEEQMNTPVDFIMLTHKGNIGIGINSDYKKQMKYNRNFWKEEKRRL